MGFLSVQRVQRGKHTVAAGVIKANMENAQCDTDMMRLNMGKVSHYQSKLSVRNL